MIAAEIAASLTEEQRKALVACVDALADLAGEGFCVAEEAIFNLFEVFGGPHTHANEEYGVWVRAILRAKEHQP